MIAAAKNKRLINKKRGINVVRPLILKSEIRVLGQRIKIFIYHHFSVIVHRVMHRLAKS